MSMFQRYAGIGLLASMGAIIVLGFAGAQGGNRDGFCMSNLKQVALATHFYSMDYDDTLPPMKTATAYLTSLQPYTKNTVIFTCPETQAMYQPNAKINHVKAVTIKTPATTWLVSDAKPHTDKLWSVAYVDGHVKQETKAPTGLTTLKSRKKK